MAPCDQDKCSCNPLSLFIIYFTPFLTNTGTRAPASHRHRYPVPAQNTSLPCQLPRPSGIRRAPSTSRASFLEYELPRTRDRMSIPQGCGACRVCERLALAGYYTHSAGVRWPDVRCLLHSYEAGCQHEGVGEGDSFGAASRSEG